MSDSEGEFPSQFGNASKYTGSSDDDEEPSTSWGLKRRKRTIGIISDSENDDDDDVAEDLAKDDADSCDSDSSGGAPGAETCAICLGRMRGEVGSPDSCEHIFCKFCILEWSKNNPTCPQDRKPFSEIVVRKTLDGPVDKKIPVKKSEEEAAFDIVLENPTYCEVCNECDREERLLLCDGCDLGYHLECLDPPLSEVPAEEWFCPLCTTANVPEVLTNRDRASTTHATARARRGSSASGRVQQQPETPRIPRTRATERIRAQIQIKKIKKKLKRKKQKERKKAKIESGEFEDRRPPVKRLNEFRMFDDVDADVDATHNEDKYAEHFLTGAVVESNHRRASERRAEAVRRLRDVAFIPQASYSGRAKNRVMEVVNTQSDGNQSDLLSGILENQAIAFSSSRKLVLTNDRKLTKQPGIEISCKMFQEEDSFLPEPLPSQRKTPEKSDPAGSSPNEKSKPVLSDEEIEEGTSVTKKIKDFHSGDSQQSQPRSSHQHSSDHRREWRNDYSHSSYNKDGSSTRKHGDYVRNRYHGQRRNDHHHDHHHSRYSSYERHSSSSWNGRNPHKPSGYGRSERRPYDRHDSSERRFDSNQNRDYSPCSKKTSIEKEGRENRYDKYDRYDKDNGHRGHSSKSRKSHSDSKGKSSLSTVHGKNRQRSHWGYNYFNSDNLFSRRSDSLNCGGSTSNTEGLNKVEDVKLSGGEGITSKQNEVLKEPSSDVSLGNSSVINSSCQKTKSNENHKSISSHSSNVVPVGSICEDSDSELCVEEESIAKVNNTELEDSSEYVNKADKESDEISSQDVPSKFKSVVGNPDLSRTDIPYIQSKENADFLAMKSEGREKSPFKTPFRKKTRIAYLFGDADENVTEVSFTIKMDENDEGNIRLGKDKGQISDQNVKSKNFLNKTSKDKNKNTSVESSCKEESDHFNTTKTEVYGKKNQDRCDLPDKYDQEVCEKFRNEEHILPRHSKETHGKHNGRRDSSCEDSKEVSDVSNNKQAVLLKDIRDVGENKCHDRNESSEILVKEVDEESIVKGDASSKSNRFNENFRDKKRSSSKDKKQAKEKTNHDRRSTFGSQSFKESEFHSTTEVIKVLEKNTSETKLESKTKVMFSVHKSKVTDIFSSCTKSSHKKRKIEVTKSGHSLKETNKYGQKKKNRNMAYGDLFGDIDDIDSSSNSNLPEVEVKPKVHTSWEATLEAKEKPTACKGVVSHGKDTLNVEQVSKSLNDLSSIQDFTDLEEWNHTSRKDLVSGSDCTSDYKPSCKTKPENDLRIKQQKASLEVKVVQEVKKALDPYYRNKSITKDEYKQIVAKCVKKVVNAECGDVIEPEKMHSLAVGYIKLFKHRQMKSQM